MLNDAIANKAQTLLHEHFPYVGGLEDTTLGTICMFSIQKGEFVHVLYNGGLQGVCISNIGCKENEVNYSLRTTERQNDSLSGSGVSWYLVQQIASIIHVDEYKLVINTKKFKNKIIV